MHPQRMSPTEVRAGASLAAVFGLRMLGLFLILPVFAVHAPSLAGGDNLTLVGLALGAYGLAQALLQFPFGIASDRWGRKPVIIAGLIIFAAGSFLAAAASDIHMVIAGRLLQGAGAISSVVSAMAADLTRAEHRTKTMAMIGATIGAAFAFSLVAAPALYDLIGMGGLFAITGVLSIAAIGVVLGVVPEPPARSHHAAGASRGRLRAAILHPELLRLNYGIFALHLVQMAMFVVVPTALVAAGVPVAAHWKIYLPVVMLSFVLMVPPILMADRRRRHKRVMLGAIALMLAVQVLFAAWHAPLAGIAALLIGFFAAFNVLEALLPSLVSRIAPEHARGAALGAYNTTQTLGLFAGGLAGGALAGHFGAAAVYMLGATAMLAWLAVAGTMGALPAIGGDSAIMRPGVNADAGAALDHKGV
jgi:MFS family permease